MVPTVDLGLFEALFCSMAMVGERPRRWSTLGRSSCPRNWRAGAQGLDIAALPLRIERVEREAAFSRSAGPGEDHELPLRDGEIRDGQVVLARPENLDEVRLAGAFARGCPGSWGAMPPATHGRCVYSRPSRFARAAGPDSARETRNRQQGTRPLDAVVQASTWNRREPLLRTSGSVGIPGFPDRAESGSLGPQAHTHYPHFPFLEVAYAAPSDTVSTVRSGRPTIAIARTAAA